MPRAVNQIAKKNTINDQTFEFGTGGDRRV
ncbi:hypothetical protein SAMN05428953_11886 [Mesorhizobium muleiense]|uniref:Uncharacterized protein n=1 Tax=Mesorhizobium muleiense TaxID=1004279 RepID=A0A1G9DPH0_9HYPH|nr:hypothetical protein SAMN05428953_11886 [Mesorhizobium muleiense]